jgi:DNA adenine methylase
VSIVLLCIIKTGIPNFLLNITPIKEGHDVSTKVKYSEFVYVERRPRQPAPVIQNGKKRIAFRWYGGKFSHLDWLLPLLPVEGVHHYCEPFGGSAAVLLNRPPSPVETYNDLDGEVVNFFRVLRDQRDELLYALRMTPFSREEFNLACSPPEEEISDLERARRFFVRAGQVRTGLAQTATLGRWSNCKKTSRSNMSGAVSRWLGQIRRLEDVAERLLRVQIENRPAIDVIELYNDSATLFYLDPPYAHEARSDTRAYGLEMTEEDHRLLAEVLHSVKGMVALSGYRCPLMDELYGDWHRIDAPVKTAHSCKADRQECLWVNYKI